MLNTGATRLPTSSSERPSYTVTNSSPINKGSNGERIIPIETTTTSPQYRV